MALIDWVCDRLIGSYRVRAGFTTRLGGVSEGEYAGLNLGPHVGDTPEAVAANRALLAAELGVDPAWMEQVHGAVLAKAAPGRTYCATDGLWIDTDSLVACADGLWRAAACVMVADCVPLLLVGTTSPIAAAVHVGRAGMLADIAPAAVEALGVEVDAFLGPAICGSCYELPAEMCEAAATLVPACCSETSWSTPSLDVPAGVSAQLADISNRLGGIVRSITPPSSCTFENKNLYSHRRATKEGTQTGRFAGIVLLEGPHPA